MKKIDLLFTLLAIIIGINYAVKSFFETNALLKEVYDIKAFLFIAFSYIVLRIERKINSK